MRITIRRFGNYINVVNSKEELHTWLMDNLPYEQGEQAVPEGATFARCLEIAADAHYTIEYDNSRLTRILDKADIVTLAKRFVKLTKRGENYTFDCPFCGEEESAYISPKYGVFKCFRCEATGGVIDFAMRMKKCSYDEALNYLDKTFKNK